MRYLHWKVGDKVVCIDDRPAVEIGGVRTALLTRGKVYTISWIGQEKWGIVYFPGCDIGVRLEGVIRPHDKPYAAARFRPVQPRKTDISIFTRMLNPQKKGVDA